MADVVDAATRSRMMAGIRGKDTKPEILLRKALFARGFRYRLHASDLPGRPDMVLPKYRAALFVHGCFWHMHDCGLFRLPSTRREFWRQKLAGNRERDARQRAALRDAGWRVMVVWECAFKRAPAERINEVADLVAGWLRSSESPPCVSIALEGGKPALFVEDQRVGDEAGERTV